jgi:hypothetical protein
MLREYVVTASARSAMDPIQFCDRVLALASDCVFGVMYVCIYVCIYVCTYVYSFGATNEIASLCALDRAQQRRKKWQGSVTYRFRPFRVQVLLAPQHEAKSGVPTRRLCLPAWGLNVTITLSEVTG